MRSYVLPGINEAQRGRLTENGVPFSNWANGILITGPVNLASALQVLEATHTEVPTQYADFYEVVLTYNADQGDIVLAEEDEYFDHDQHGDPQPDETHPPGTLLVEEEPYYPEYGYDEGPGPRRTADPVRTTGENNPVRLQTQPEEKKADDPAALLAQSRKNYMEVCSIRLQEVRENLRQLTVPTLASLHGAESRYFAAVRQAAQADEPVSDEQLRHRFAAEIAQIRALQKVHHVRVIPDGVLIFTDELRITVPDAEGAGPSERKIGRFLLWLRLSGNEPGPRWFNSTRRVKGARDSMNAPYVYADGRPSCDEITVSLTELIARCEIAAAVDLAIQYVETFNPENPLSEYATKWPAVKRRKRAE